MDILNFSIDKPIHFNLTGKFEAPNEYWVHSTRNLTDFELFFMTEGELYIADEENEYIVRKDEYLLMSPTDHQYGYHPSNCVFYWAHFSYHNFHNDPVIHNEEGIGKPLNAAQTRILLPRQCLIPRLDRLIVLLKQLQDCNRKYQNQHLNSYTLTTILCELYSQLYLSHGRSVMKGEKAQLYTDIVDYISWRIRENIKVNEIAAYFGYNEKYITTFFKKCSGDSLKSYILNQKMELAKALLTDTNLPIAQVGYEIGFSDNHNFSAAFKRVTGQTPSDYRNTYAERMLFHQ